jgi:DNA-binding transcriptional LysR family regulator
MAAVHGALIDLPEMHGKAVEIKVSGRLVLNDLATKLTACAAGHGIAQAFEFGLDRQLASGELVQILADWAQERFPLYAYHPSRHLPPAKVRAFLDFVVASLASPTPRRMATASAADSMRQRRFPIAFSDRSKKNC